MENLTLFDDLLQNSESHLNNEQENALTHLLGSENVFLTGGAGTGKSFLIHHFLKLVDQTKTPVLASTGTAAVLVGGRTFHSFFGLGLMEGGVSASVERALKDKRVSSRLRKAQTLIIDEISMIPGEALNAAEEISCQARNSPNPWGGLKIIAVGDFAQLPPISRDKRRKDWAFKSDAWFRSNFKMIELRSIMRSVADPMLCEALQDVRDGIVSEKVIRLLDSCSEVFDGEIYTGSLLFPRKTEVDSLNLTKLSELGGEQFDLPTIYTGEDRFQRILEKTAPINNTLSLKKDALVMLRQNDPRGRWVNGSLAHVKIVEEDTIMVQLFNDQVVDVNRSTFSLFNADGKEVASAKNFPLSLAWAVTIHKSQGATLDRVFVTLRNLWESGQAYVALSRIRHSKGLKIGGWDEKSIRVDPEVLTFHESLRK